MDPKLVRSKMAVRKILKSYGAAFAVGSYLSNSLVLFCLKTIGIFIFSF